MVDIYVYIDDGYMIFYLYHYIKMVIILEEIIYGIYLIYFHIFNMAYYSCSQVIISKIKNYYYKHISDIHYIVFTI